MKTDSQIQHNVFSEQKWQPQLTALNIGVAVTDGVATLSGIADAYAQKMAAKKPTKLL